LNDSFRAVNQLLDAGVAVQRVYGPSWPGLRPGDFLVSADAPNDVIEEVARETGVDFQPLDVEVTQGAHPLTRRRIGMYQRYYGGNTDGGVTRVRLEWFEFPYTNLFDAEIQAGDLNAKYDVIILPADGLSRMTGERDEDDGRGRGGYGSGPEDYPPEYRSGFGQLGITALEAFVESGGTLLTFAQAGDLPIEKFELPLRNVVANLPPTEFWSPGSTLRVNVAHDHPLTLGMPADALATFLAGGQVYQVVPSPRNERVERIMTFGERDILHSGWLIGEDLIAEKAAMVSVEHGEGRVVLIGFRPQHRMQTHGTFKLVFNSLLSDS
jgi:hypothetical protein